MTVWDIYTYTKAAVQLYTNQKQRTCHHLEVGPFERNHGHGTQVIQEEIVLTQVQALHHQRGCNHNRLGRGV